MKPLLAFLLTLAVASAADRPNIIFVMADDMGWGQTSYNGHPILKTPNLDAMAAGGLRFDRFYAGGPVCSPTRASVLTGRSHDRAGVRSHGYALRLQEKTVAQALRAAGYVTGHFGKWHLNGFSGPGAPVLATDERHPGRFGFDEWVSVTNFFDQNPILSRAGKIEEFKGDSSDIVIGEAVKFIERHRGAGKPFFAVVWYGSPHSPYRALPEDKAAFASLPEASADHHGELVAMDRSIGTLRRKLRELGVADNTMVVFCSDNGGLPGITPETVGGLRGFKGTVYEGGLRVPGIIEWPAAIKPRISKYPACVMDLFPTVADIVGLPSSALVQPIDGESLKPLFTRELASRGKPIPFRFQGRAALVDNRYKIVSDAIAQARTFELYDLEADPKEARDLFAERPELAAKMKQQIVAFHASVEASVAGKDYPEGRVTPADPESVHWAGTAQYKPYLATWTQRWEYAGVVEAAAKKGKKKK